MNILHIKDYLKFIESKNAVREEGMKHQLLLCDDLECIQPQCLPWILVDSFKLEIVCAFSWSSFCRYLIISFQFIRFSIKSYCVYSSLACVFLSISEHYLEKYIYIFEVYI